MVRLIVPIILIALCALSDLYIYHRYINTTSMWRWSWWFPLVVLTGFFVKFLFFNKGLVEEYTTTNLFLLLMGLICIPKILFSLLSLIPKVGTYAGLALALGIVWIILWGITFGFTKFRVREITYESPAVPHAFDGYRIVQFSDSHTGTFRGPYKHLLAEGIDSINALNPDLVCFVGDIENFSPEELKEHRESFCRLKAKDGVFSIMGNHDYSSYIKVTDRERAALVAETRSVQRSFGWDLLSNESRVITREYKDKDGNVQKDSIIVIGEENWGKKPFPQYGNIRKAIAGLHINADGRIAAQEDGTPSLTIMLSHDPTAWEKHIIPVFHPDITLSGHTHGTQFSLFSWSPSSMIYDQWGGEYTKTIGSQDMLLSVSTGFGGNFPFRFNMPREVVVITLKHKD